MAVEIRTHQRQARSIPLETGDQSSSRQSATQRSEAEANAAGCLVDRSCPCNAPESTEANGIEAAGMVRSVEAPRSLCEGGGVAGTLRSQHGQTQAVGTVSSPSRPAEQHARGGIALALSRETEPQQRCASTPARAVSQVQRPPATGCAINTTAASQQLNFKMDADKYMRMSVNPVNDVPATSVRSATGFGKSFAPPFSGWVHGLR